VRVASVAILVCSIFLALIPTQHLQARTREARSDSPPVVLLLVRDGLSWESAETSGLATVFEDGATATVSVAQGPAPKDPRLGYVVLGAGSRVDTSLLPEGLPTDRSKIPGAFDGSAATIQLGALGDALSKADIQRAAVGESAALMVMDSRGRVPNVYTGDPKRDVQKALRRGAEFVAVEAPDVPTAAGVAKAVGDFGGTVAVTAPNAPPDEANLTPFAVSGPKGVLYSPGTRTTGLLSNEDLAPTLLDRLGVQTPPEIAGRVAVVKRQTAVDPATLQDRLAFVDEERTTVWTLLIGALAVVLILGTFRWSRTGLRSATLFLVALPFGTLAAALVPIGNAVVVAVLAALAAGGLVILAWRLSPEGLGSLTVVALVTVTVVVLDAVFGGATMGFSVLGHDPAYGTRFYGIGNEYSAVVAGALPLGAGVVARFRPRLVELLPVIGVLTVVALGLPAMGADVGGSLALGVGFGAMVGFLRSGRLSGAIAWAGGGAFVAVAVFVGTGLLTPDASHGARAASGDLALYEVALRKIFLSLRHLLNPLWTVLLVALAVLAFMGWQRAGGKSAAAGILGAVVAAVASGVLNDSGILATLLALAYPAAAGAMTLVRPRNPAGRIT